MRGRRLHAPTAPVRAVHDGSGLPAPAGRTPGPGGGTASLRSPGALWRACAAALLWAGAAGAARGQPLSDCHVAGIPQDVKCGVVRRALDPAHPGGTSIEVHYVVVPAMARRKLADPVFLVPGGPGQSAIGVAPQVLALFGRLNHRRDLVFVDQRGTGRSAPLNCPQESHGSPIELGDTQHQFKQLMQCQAQLLKLPYIGSAGALGFFTTTLAMQDLDAVRAQMGAQQIDLVGISYGTRAVLEYMRLFPARVRRSVLDAVAPPDMVLPVSASVDTQAALDALFEACGRERACQQAYPHLAADWRRFIASLPQSVSAADPLSGQPQHFSLTRGMALGAVRSVLYTPAIAAGLPQAITQAAQGRYEPLLGLGSVLESHGGLRLATGMHFSVVCAEDGPALDRDTATGGSDFGADVVELYRLACAHWPRGGVAPAFYTLPRTSTPTLLLSGGLDPATPPRHAQRVAAALGPAAQLVVQPQGGHGALGSECGRDVLFQFIDAADPQQAASVDTQCLRTVPRPLTFLPIAAEPTHAP